MHSVVGSFKRMHNLVLSPGEECLTSLVEYCNAQRIVAASLSAIGAVREVELGAFEIDSKSYHKFSPAGVYELIALNGNIAIDNDSARPMAHLHVCLADHQGRCLGGQLFKAVCAVTVEFFLVEFEGQLTRRLDDFSGLKLLSALS